MAGRPRKITSTGMLLTLFESYILWVKKNPIIKPDFVGGAGRAVKRKLQRPLTWAGFESYLYNNNIINDLGDYESNKNKKYEEFSTIITRIKKIIQADQVEGGLVGIYNSNLTARINGISEKGEIDLTSKGKELRRPSIVMIPADSVSEEIIAKFMSGDEDVIHESI